ncbi:MAG TPA: amino acid adenylation domain-containing protein [Candidatus Angelobacter sp.]
MFSALDERRASLSPAKQALLEQRLRGERSSSPASLPIVHVENRRQLPLSHAQQRLWFIHQLDPESTAYNLLFAVRLSGALNREAVQWSVDEIVRRHEVLRTTFLLEDGVPLQQPALSLHVPVEYLDVSHRNHHEAEIEATNLAQELAARPFHLREGPLLRARLVALEDQEHIFVVSMHHIVSDAWSTAIMMREFSQLYKAYVIGSEAPLTIPPIQYADYAVWQRGWLRGPVLDAQLNYWRKQLQDTPVLGLPTDCPRTAVISHRGASVDFHIGRTIVSNLTMINQQEKTTLFMELLAAFAVLLSRYSGQSDLTIGSPIANRNRVELENLIGFFVNMLTFRMDLQGNPTFRQMLRQVQQTAFDAYQYQDVPFEKIVEELQPEREMNRTPVFQITLTLQNAEQGSIELPDLSLSPFDVPVPTTMYELSLFFNQSGQGLDATLLYCCDLFEPQTMVRFSRHMESVLELMSRAPDTPIHGWSLLAGAEQQEVLVEWNQLHRCPCDKVLPAWFEEQVRRTPNATAVVCEDGQLSYNSLNSRANQLAHRLKKFSVGPEIKVAMCMERSLEMVAGILGTMKAGGVYVPIDPSYPPERISYMLNDSNAKVLLTHPSMESTLPESSIPILSLDPHWETIAEESPSNPELSISPDNGAYVIYTSGSTGQPKGVLVTHSNVVRLFTATQQWFGFTDQDVWTLFHSYAFDFSVWELWGALLYGGRLIVVPYWLSRSPEAFYQLLQENKVTVLNQTPSAFRQLSDVEATKPPGAEELSLRCVVFGGEALEMSSLRPWLARHGAHRPQLINMYGITETTVHATYQQLDREAIHRDASVVGDRIPDLQIYILDDYMQPVPVGVKGEIFIGGAGLARGYMNRPDLTAQRFVPNPFSQTAGERLYRSGDQARWRNDGSIEYLGRIDHQVKIRGFRIELGEIEAALLEAGISQAVVMAQKEGAGEKRLIAHVVLENAGNQEFMQELRAKLKHRLPGYMVPAAIVPIEKIPLTGNGKIDRKALLAFKPEKVLSERRFAPPQTPIEETMCRILEDVLELERVGIEDNFFELGGDSILSIQVMARARKAGLQFSLAQFFASRHIKELARSITVIADDQAAQPGLPFRLLSEEDCRRIPAGVVDAYPLSGLQAGMLFHTEFRGATSFYHNVLSCHVRAHLDAEILQKAVDEVVILHPVLRTSLDLGSYSEPLQLVHLDARIRVAFENIKHLSIAEQEDILTAWIEAERQRPFDVCQPGLLRFQVHDRSGDTSSSPWRSTTPFSTAGAWPCS